MDNPNVSIASLFAGFEESFKKYDQKQRLKKRPRTRRVHQPLTARACAETKPLFGSLLKPISNIKQDASSQDHASENTDEGKATAPFNFRGSQPTTAWLSRLVSQDDEPTKTMEDKAGMSFFAPLLETTDNDALLASPEKVTTSSSLANAAATSSNQADHVDSSTPSVPEYIPLCERQRREAVAADLMSKAKGFLTQKPNPLSWNKPSFHFQSETERNAKAADSCTDQLGKRKALCAPITDHCGLDTIMPWSLSSRQQTYNPAISSIPSSSSIFSYDQYPCYGRKYKKEDVDSLVAMAKEWITPDMKRRKRL